jgi:protein ImuB
MYIPSYDDLTPGIADVHPRETFDQVTRLLPSSDGPVVSTLRHSAPGRTRTPQHPGAPCRTPQHPAVFACLRARGATAAGLLSLAKDFSPRIERHGEACIVLDVSGLGRLLGDAHGIGSALQQAATDRGVKARLAVASTQTAVRLLTLHAETSVVPGDVAAALAPLPLDLLALFESTGPSDPRTLRTLDALRRWGLRIVGEFAALPAEELAARFGAAGLALHRLARGLDPCPLTPDPGVPRFLQVMELEWPLEALEPLSFVLARLLEPLSSALERADRAGAAIRLTLRLVDRTTHVRMLQLPAPIRDPRVLRTLLLLDLESHPPAAAIDIVTVEVDPAPARIIQFSLLERAIPSAETIATLTARLEALVGEARCGSPVLIDSHRPDAFEMRRFHPDERRTDSGMLEPLNAGPLHLRRFRPPVAVRVGVERGHPASVAIERRGMPGGRVEQFAGPWRSSGAWWDGTGAHWDHDEWEVALSDGSICRVFCDRETQRWFLQGVVD